MTPNKEQIITFILAELEKGTNRVDVFSQVAEKWSVASRTFDRFWKTAKDRHERRQQETQRQIADISTSDVIEGLEEAVISKNTRMQIASAIATNPLNDPGDRLKALDYLSRIDGDYAPVKKEHKVELPKRYEVNFLD